MARQLGRAGVTVVLAARDPRQVSRAELRPPGHPHQQRRCLPGQFGSGLPSATADEVIQQTFDTDLFAPVALTRVLLPLLKKSEAGLRRTMRADVWHRLYLSLLSEFVPDVPDLPSSAPTAPRQVGNLPHCVLDYDTCHA